MDDLSVWAVVGYPGTLSNAERPYVQLGATIEDDDEYGDGQLLETEADLDKGQSGGPFWAWFPGNHARIVGVVQGEVDFGTDFGLFQTHDHDNSAAGGADMVNLVRQARADWPV